MEQALAILGSVIVAFLTYILVLPIMKQMTKEEHQAICNHTCTLNSICCYCKKEVGYTSSHEGHGVEK